MRGRSVSRTRAPFRREQRDSCASIDCGLLVLTQHIDAGAPRFNRAHHFEEFLLVLLWPRFDSAEYIFRCLVHGAKYITLSCSLPLAELAFPAGTFIASTVSFTASAQMRTGPPAMASLLLYGQVTKAIGLTIPAAFLALADKVIE
jgi:hypothetical protein